MIILISGSTHTGKTNLAQRLLDKYRYPYLSIDHLKMGLIRSGKINLTAEDDELLTPQLWIIIKEIIKTAVENKQNLIVEGCYIPFDWKKDFSDMYLANIKFICLVMSKNYIINHFSDICRYSNIIENRMSNDNLNKENLISENNFNLKMCKKYNLPYHVIDKVYCASRLLIRKYRPSDVKSMANLFYETVHAINTGDYTGEQLDAWAPSNIDLNVWNQRFKNSNTVVAEECGIIIGFGNMDSSGYLDMLYIHKDRQRQQIGTKITDRLEQHALRAGIKKGYTFSSITARPFFECLGWRTICDNIVIRNGISLKNYKMEKKLGIL